MTHTTQNGFSSQSAAGAKSIWFDRRELDALLDLAVGGAADLTALQVAALA